MFQCVMFHSFLYRQDGSTNHWSDTSMNSCDYSQGVKHTKEYISQNSVSFGSGEYLQGITF